MFRFKEVWYRFGTSLVEVHIGLGQVKERFGLTLVQFQNRFGTSPSYAWYRFEQGLVQIQLKFIVGSSYVQTKSGLSLGYIKVMFSISLGLSLGQVWNQVCVRSMLDIN